MSRWFPTDVNAASESARKQLGALMLMSGADVTPGDLSTGPQRASILFGPMARPRPPHIVENILDAGERAMIADGYASTSIGAIAREAGVAVGSVYHYFADREALLDWVVLRVLRPDVKTPTELPIGAPTMTIEEAIVPYLDVHDSLPRLHDASARDLDRPIVDELREVIDEFCELVVSTDRVQTMVEVCSNDLEPLRKAWYLDYRRALALAYEEYFARRVQEGSMRPIADPRFAARWLLDSAILFLRLRRLDYYPDELPTQNLTEQLVNMMLLGFAGAD